MKPLKMKRDFYLKNKMTVACMARGGQFTPTAVFRLQGINGGNQSPLHQPHTCPTLAQVVTEGFQAVRRSELALPRYLRHKDNVG